MENVFGIFKLSFRQFLLKLELEVSFLPDVITTCVILHNMFLGQSHVDVEMLLHILHTEGLEVHGIDED